MKKRSFAVLCVLTLALTACGSSSEKPSSGSTESGASGPHTAITVEFTYTWKGEYAPLVYADEKGLFAKQGLDVTFKEGKGSQVTYSSLGDGPNTFVIGPSGTAAQAASTGVPVTNVATFIPVTPSVLVAKNGTQLKTPKDLEGKTVGLRSGADASLFFSSFLKTNNVDASKVKVSSLDGSAANAAFLSGQVQVVDVFSNNELPTLTAKLDGKAPNTLAFSDFGFTILGQGVSVSNAFLKSSPDIIKKFLIAETAGIEAAKKNPVDAAKVLKSRHSAALPDESIVEQQVKATLDAMVPESGHPLGYVSAPAWDKMLDLFQQTGQIKNRLSTATYYTNDLLPK